MTDRAIYRRDELMQLLGYRDKGAFRAWRTRAEAMGFPPPLPGRTRPLAWSRGQVDAWLAAGGRPAQLSLAETAAAPAPTDELAAARARLALRSRA